MKKKVSLTINERVLELLDIYTARMPYPNRSLMVEVLLIEALAARKKKKAK